MRPPERLVLPNGSAVLLVGIVRGLAEERTELDRLLGEEGWSVVGIGCSPDRWEECAAASDNPLAATEHDPLTARYLRRLARWGTPEDPDRWLSHLRAACAARGLASRTLDLSDDRYAERAAALISGWALARQALRLRRLRRRRISAETPEEFAVRWELAAAPGAGFRTLSDERETAMAESLLRLADEAPAQRVLAVVEAERSPGVLTQLQARIRGAAP